MLILTIKIIKLYKNFLNIILSFVIIKFLKNFKGHEILQNLNKSLIVKKCKGELQTAEIRAILVV